jgi:hypothetical protein
MKILTFYFIVNRLLVAGIPKIIGIRYNSFILKKIPGEFRIITLP